MAMNKILAKVESIKQNKNLHKVNFSSNVGNLAFVSLDVELKENQEVTLGFRSNSVAISKEKSEHLSYSNQICVLISQIEKGEILTKITAFKDSQKLTSVITTDSANRLNLKLHDSVVFLVKATDVFIVNG
ncbi:ModE family transcriptional regulator [Campylobacter geochelonis]|nr:ModE family transcriptional regulator [Campylobacter geochelonis]